MIYTTKATITKAEVERWNFLLANDFADMTDEQTEKYKAKADDYEGGFCFEFEDGSNITMDLCSGDNNYYDDAVWISADGMTNVNFDCSYEIVGEDKREVFNVGDDTYVIEWEVEE